MSSNSVSVAKEITQLGRPFLPYSTSKRKAKLPESVYNKLFGSLINENLPEGSNVSLIGPPGAGKTVFCENLANSFLRNGVSCLYITLDNSPDDVRRDFQKFGTDLFGKKYEKKLAFVDCFSWLTGESREGHHIDDLGNLTELSIRISSAANDLAKPLVLVFDSVSPLTVYNPEIVVIKFLQIVLARMKDWKGMGIYVVQKGVHSEEFYNTLAYLVDGIFDMKISEKNGKLMRQFRIRSLKSMAHETKWISFDIQPDRSLKLKHTRRKRK